MALHGTGKTLTLGGADDIDLLAGDKVARRDGRADLENGILGHAELGHLRLWQDVRLGKMATKRLRDVLRLGGAGTKLQGGIAVTLLLAHRHNLHFVHLHNRHRHVLAGLGEDPCHAKLACNNSATHCVCPFPRA